MDSEWKLAQSAKGMGRNTEDSLRRPLPRNQRYAPGQKNVQAVPTPAPVLFAGAGMVHMAILSGQRGHNRRPAKDIISGQPPGVIVA